MYRPPHAGTPAHRTAMPTSTKPTYHQAHEASRAARLDQSIHSLRALRLAASNRMALESFLLGMLALAVFIPAAATMLGACLRTRAALIAGGPATRQGPAVEKGPAPCGAGTPDTPQESRGEKTLFESIPPARSGKLQRHLGQLDAASRSNLERHLNNPNVSSTAICNSLRRQGLIIGNTTVKDFRRQSAARIRSEAGHGTNGTKAPRADEA